MTARTLRHLALAAALCAGAAHAGGPLDVCNGAPLKYATSTVGFNYDRGNLGPRSKAQADAIVNAALAMWTNVPTATINLTRGADLPVDVTVSNFTTYVGSSSSFSDGLNPVVYDTDGSIIDAMLGAGAKSSTLGFAGSAYSTSQCRYLEGRAVISGYLNITDAGMTTVIAHELGHFIGLDHTQLDSTQGLANSNYPLMYPIAYRTLLSLHDDDIAAVSAIYPEASVATAYGEVTGTFKSGTTALRGGNLWAREVSTQRVFSTVSDYFQQGTGAFRMLLPPGTYTLRAEAISSQFDGGSSVGPYSDTYPTSPSFQAPFYVNGTPMAPVTLGGSANPIQIQVTAGCSASVAFQLNGTGTVGGNCATPLTYVLGVTRSGSGTVTSSPAGISCGTSCSAAFNAGAVVSLTPAPAAGWVFSGWTGACSGGGACSVTMSQARNVTAAFVADDDYPDVFSFAPGVGLTSITDGNLGSSSDADWFRFDFIEAGTWTVRTTGTTDTVGAAYAADGATLYASDNNSDSPNFRITLAIGGPVSVYLKVTGSGGAAGAYSLVSDFTPGAVRAAAVEADANRDGRSDLVWRNQSTGQVYRMLMNGFNIASGALAFQEPDTAWKIVAHADVNGGGGADLVWKNALTGVVFASLFDTNGQIAGGVTMLQDLNPAKKIVAAPDFDGDGISDLLWWDSATGRVYAMLMGGAALPTGQGLIYTEPDTSWRIVGAGDFAGSGRRNQLLWRHRLSGEVYMMTVGFAGGAFSVSGASIYREPNTAWKIVAAADFNGDRRTDILWRNDSTGQVYMMLMNGFTIAAGAPVYQEPNLAWKIVANGDYDGDGKADIVWRNDATGDVYMMLMNGLAIGSGGLIYREPDPAWKILGPAEFAAASGL